MTIPFLKPNVVPVDHYVDRLRTSDTLRWYSNMGPHVTEFETRAVEELLGGVGRAVTVCNATIGLMLAIAAVKRSGRYAIMPSFTFAATPLAAQWCGLTPYFVDVRPGDWCPDEQAIEAALELLGDEAAVVVSYATFGVPMPLARYESWHARGIPVVIDAAPCLGTRGLDGPFAAGFPGPVVYSLHATKAFSVGEGGLIASADDALVQRIRRMSSFGFDSGRESIGLGLNAKMPEVSAAIALATLDAFPQKLAARQALHAEYMRLIAARGLLQRGWETQRFAGCVPHQFMPLLLPPGMTNERAVVELSDLRVGARTYFSPVCHRQRGFLDCPHGPLPVTEDMDQRALSLPLWEDMQLDEVATVVDALEVITERHAAPLQERMPVAA
jgi:dTDP-4-amino-4,6-dideoxygalactose transaminase